MKPRELATVLSAAFALRANLLVTGAPGIGKTDIITSTAAQAGVEVMISHPAVQDPTYASGLPWFDGKGGATHLPFGNLARAIKADRPTVWFLDDLGQAPPAVQAAYMQLLLARELDGQRISEHITFVAATNRRGDRAGVSGILEPVKSRFHSIVELEACPVQWREWGVKNGLNPTLLAFIAFRPALLSDFKPTADLTNSPSPRGWKAVNGWLQAGLPMTILEPTLAGAVGPQAAGELCNFLAMAKQMPDPAKVLADPARAPIPNDASVQWALVTALADLASRSGTEAVEAAVLYTKRLFAAGLAQMGTLLIQDLLQRSPEAHRSLAIVALLTDRSNGIAALLAA